MIGSICLAIIGATLSVSASSSPGCGKELPSQISPGESENFSIEVQGLKRHYRIHIPRYYDKDVAAPLILSYHGRGKNMTEQEDLSQFSDEQFNTEAIAVYPQGHQREWQGDPRASTNDLVFTGELLDHLEGRYCIDETRIYAAGKSNGGGFVNVMACDKYLSSRIAAFAPVSGAFYEYTTGTCSPSRTSIPMLEFHGLNDSVIPYEGSSGELGHPLPPIPLWLQGWAGDDGCDTTDSGKVTLLFEGNVTRTSWSCGKNKNIVIGYLTQNLGHAWPSTVPNDDLSEGTYFNATPIIMKFFGKHALTSLEDAGEL